MSVLSLLLFHSLSFLGSSGHTALPQFTWLNPIVYCLPHLIYHFPWVVHPEPVSLCFSPQSCKILNYAHFRRGCDALFIVFALVFFYTRLIFFPTQ